MRTYACITACFIMLFAEYAKKEKNRNMHHNERRRKKEVYLWKMLCFIALRIHSHVGKKPINFLNDKYQKKFICNCTLQKFAHSSITLYVSGFFLFIGPHYKKKRRIKYPVKDSTPNCKLIFGYLLIENVFRNDFCSVTHEPYVAGCQS